MKKAILVLLLASLVVSAHGQVIRETSMMKDVFTFKESYRSSNLDESRMLELKPCPLPNGDMLMPFYTFKGGQTFHVAYNRFNKHLELEEKLWVALEDDASLVGSHFTATHLYHLFTTKKGGFKLVTLDLHKFELSEEEGTFPSGIMEADLLQVDNLLYCVLTFTNKIQVHKIALLGNGETTLIKTIASGPGRVLNIQNLYGQLVVSFALEPIHLKAKIAVFEDGEPLGKTIDIHSMLPKKVSDLTLFEQADGSYLLIGAYCETNGQYVSGIFKARLGNEKITEYKEWAFHDLFPEGKIEGYSRKGYFMRLQPVQQMAGGYLVVAERFIEAPLKDVSIGIKESTYFDHRSYQSTHFALITLNEAAEFKWGNAYPIKKPEAKKAGTIRIASRSPEPIVNARAMGDTLLVTTMNTRNVVGRCLSSKGKRIPYFTVNDKLVQGFGSSAVDMGWDKVETGITADHIHWYGDCLFVYGVFLYADRGVTDLSKFKSGYFVSKYDLTSNSSE